MRNQDAFGPINAYLEEQMKRLNIPGAAIAIVEGDQVVYQRGFGKSRPGGGPPTPRTLFFIGSLTKSFTALAVMQLIEAGKVRLDDTIQSYLPWFTLADPEAASRMTVRHLLNQTSGISTWSGWIPIGELDERGGPAERKTRAFSTIKLQHPLGSTFEYSNLNYILLGQIIETVSHESYADYVQNQILNPLGMDHTYASETEAKQNGLAAGYRYWFWQPFPSPNSREPCSSLPAGGLISSVEDLGHYMIAQLNGGRCGAGRVLSSSGMAEMHHPAATFDLMGWSAHYGMGWYTEQLEQTQMIWHGGTMPNFATFMGLFPEQKKGFALLINVDHFMMNPVITEIGHSLADILAGQQSQPGPLGIRFASFAPWATRALLLIPLLQILDVAATLRRLRRWRQHPQGRPSQRRLLLQHLLLPLILSLGCATVPVFLQAKKRLAFLRDYFPDLAWITILGGIFAGIWACLRAVLLVRELHKPGSPSVLKR